MQDEQRRLLRHDLLGCLNSMRLSMEVIRDSRDGDERVVFLDAISNEVAKIEAMIDKLIYQERDQQPGLQPGQYHFFASPDSL